MVGVTFGEGGTYCLQPRPRPRPLLYPVPLYFPRPRPRPLLYPVPERETNLIPWWICFVFSVCSDGGDDTDDAVSI